jgi:hypothetical protein
MRKSRHSQLSRWAAWPKLIAFASLVMLFAACDLIDSGSKSTTPHVDTTDTNQTPDTIGVSGLTSSWIGTHLDSLKVTQSLAFRDGRLYVTHRHATTPGTAVIDTATGNIVEYYPHLIKPSGMAFTDSGHLVVGEGSWGQPGGISVINPVTKRIRQSVINFDQDNVVRAVDGRVYLFDRTASVVTGFTGNTPGINITLDVQTGANSNPYGIAVSGGKGYIARYNKASLLILSDVNALGGGTRDSIDLSVYAHAEGGGIPFMSAVVAHGGYILVALERWKSNYSAQDSGLVVVINAATKAIEKTITLNFKNPGAGVVKDGVWYIAALGAYGTNDGGVEKIDLAARTHAGTVVTEATLGGDVGSIAITGANSGYATYSTDFFATTRVKKF